MKFTYIVIFFCNIAFCLAQVDTTAKLSKKSYIKIIQSQKLKEILSIYRERNSLEGKVKGYRIQIYNGDRDMANSRKIKFISIFPELDAEVVFQSPEFKTVVGAYRTRLQASRALKDIRYFFRNAFIIKMDLNIDLFYK